MIHFQLVSTKGMKFDQEVYEVLVPTKDGVVAFFENHMPLISAGAPGVLSVRKKADDSDSSMEQFAVAGGVVQVDGKTVQFLSDEITDADEASEAEAQAALDRAKELVAGASDQMALHEAKHMLNHSSAKLHIAKLKRHRHK